MLRVYATGCHGRYVANRGLPIGMVLPGDVVVMLATDGYLTCQTINVNGGWYMS
jgi:hypothetical protein